MDRDREQEIIERVRHGEQDAFAILVDAYKGAIFNLAFRMTGSYQDADDLAQETFFRAFRNLRHYDSQKSFFTWIYTISLNLVRNHLKKQGRRSSGNAADGIVAEAGVKNSAGLEGTLIQAQEISHLDICLQKLPMDLRELIVLRFYQELSFEDIAMISGASLSAVKMRVYRGLERLKHLMEES